MIARPVYLYICISVYLWSPDLYILKICLVSVVVWIHFKPRLRCGCSRYFIFWSQLALAQAWTKSDSSPVDSCFEKVRLSNNSFLSFFHISSSLLFSSGISACGVSCSLTLKKKLDDVPMSETQMFTTEKYSPLKNIHPRKYSSLRMIHSWKYSPLKNIHSWKIFTLEKYSPLKSI